MAYFILIVINVLECCYWDPELLRSRMVTHTVNMHVILWSVEQSVYKKSLYSTSDKYDRQWVVGTHSFPNMKEHLRKCKFTDENLKICMSSGWLEDQEKIFSRMESVLCRNAGTSCWRPCWLLRSDKIWCCLLWLTVSGYKWFERPS